MQAASTTSHIPFDGGNSYVVRGLPVKDDIKYRDKDNMGRTELDRQFLNQFEEICLAASSGDLKKCQSIINNGFCDFMAVSYGRFRTSSGKRLDGISPMQIAEMADHKKIIQLFQEVQSKMTTSRSASLQNRVDVVSPNQRGAYCDQDYINAQKLQQDLLSALLHQSSNGHSCNM